MHLFKAGMTMMNRQSIGRLLWLAAFTIITCNGVLYYLIVTLPWVESHHSQRFTHQRWEIINPFIINCNYVALLLAIWCLFTTRHFKELGWALLLVLYTTWIALLTYGHATTPVR